MERNKTVTDQTGGQAAGKRNRAKEDPTALDLEIIEREQERREKQEKQKTKKGEKKATKNQFVGTEDDNIMVTNGLQQYLDEIRLYAPRLLSKEEELWLGSRVKDYGDERAFQTLVLFNTRLVIKLALAYYKKNDTVPLLDVIQNGNMGLMTAAKKYDYTKGFKFSTYATWWIRQSIYRQCNKQRNMVAYPSGMIEKISKVNKAVERYEKKNHKEPSLNDLIKATGFTEEEILEIWKIKEGPVYLDEKFDEEDGEGKLQDMLTTGEETDPYNHTAKVMLLNDMGILKEKLPAADYEILKLRFGLDNTKEHNITDIAKMKGKSSGWVTDKIRDILTKLKDDSDMIDLASYIS